MGVSGSPPIGNQPTHAVAGHTDEIGTGGEMFDRYAMVDWSASATPRKGKDSIWIADSASGAVQLSNPSTRRAAAELLSNIVTEVIDRGQRLLLGIDVSLGAPRGTAALFNWGAEVAWRGQWRFLAEHVVDGADNHNNRFGVAAGLNARAASTAPASSMPASAPFWLAGNNAPNLRALEPHLRGSKPADFGCVDEFRRVELVLRERRLFPKSLWQLTGAGSVGSQSLTAIPILERLRERFHGAVTVWPFDYPRGIWPKGVGPRSGPSDGAGPEHLAPGTVVIAEIWPRLVETELAEMVSDETTSAATPGDQSTGAKSVGSRIAEEVASTVPTVFAEAIPDAAQVAMCVSWYRYLDRTGQLSGLMSAIPTQLDADTFDTVVNEEGWVVGVNAPHHGA